MNSILRLCAAINKVRCGNPLDCLEEMKQVLSEMPECDIAVFPKLSLCAGCGSLASNPAIIEQCSEALDGLADFTKDMDSYVIAGLALEDLGRPVCAIALLYRGELVAYIPAADSPAPFSCGGFSDQLVPASTVFACGSMRFCIISCGFSSMPKRVLDAAQTGCDLIIIPAYEPVYAGLFDEIRASLRSLSLATGCAIALVNGGVGDTSSPYVYNGFVAIYEHGEELAAAKAGYESFSCTIDLDLDIIRAGKRSESFEQAGYSIQPVSPKRGLLRQIGKHPFLPKQNAQAYWSELFALQVRSLAARMENIGIARLVVGVSGGLDSTAALLVCAGAMDALGLPRENIVAISMPGFGTTDRTYYNALSLMERIGATARDIPIRQSVRQHFEDIGHSGKKDTAYENAQARERAQILLDVANIVGGIVVGTGDMSEAAMGFCTFAGDHIANYNVNASITKTALRALVAHIAEENLIADVADTIADILDTPVSPELLPANENGEIEQKTEDILAPYELLDFFLYYFIKYHFRPSKLYFYACVAFAGVFSPDFIKEKLRLFLRSFCAGQFKRACTPDGAALTEVNLSPASFYIPSDLDSAGLLRELDEI